MLFLGIVSLLVLVVSFVESVWICKRAGLSLRLAILAYFVWFSIPAFFIIKTLLN